MAELSAITSVLAIAISSVTLGWTIYRDAIRRPKLRVRIAIKSIIQKGQPNLGPYIFIEGLNIGPIPNRANAVFARKAWWERFTKGRANRIAFIYPDYSNPATTRAGTKLEIGDEANFVFPYAKDCFLKTKFRRIGICDGFGRMHWAKRKALRIARQQYFKAFPS